jgi:hypothetical protein
VRVFYESAEASFRAADLLRAGSGGVCTGSGGHHRDHLELDRQHRQNWTDPTQWSTNPNYPNNETPSGTEYDAVINAPGAGPYTVTLNSDVTTDSVTIDSANATLFQTGSTLTTTSLNTSLNILAGTYVISDSSIGLPRTANTGTIQVTNSGFFAPARLDNTSGTIEVDSGGTLTMLNSVSNASQLGTLINNGGTIQLESEDIVDSAGQTFTFGGPTGTWIFNQSLIEGGTVDFAPTTVLESHLAGNYPVFEDLTLGSNLTMSQDSGILAVTDVNGGGYTINITGDGTTLRVGPPHGASVSTLSNVTVNLGGNTANGTGGYVFSQIGTLFLDSLTTVQGWGFVGTQPGAISGNPSLINDGLISANVSGQTLSIVPNLTNDGTVWAVNGGILNVYAYTGFGNIEGIFAIDSQSRINVGLSAFVENNSVLDVALGSNGASGILSINGSINFLGDADLNLSLAPGAVFSTPYEIASYTRTLTGTFSNVTPGFVVDYSQPGEILVTAIPEPGACAFVAAGAFGVLTTRRRRRGGSPAKP